MALKPYVRLLRHFGRFRSRNAVVALKQLPLRIISGPLVQGSRNAVVALKRCSR